jgi:hypothetical protein
MPTIASALPSASPVWGMIAQSVEREGRTDPGVIDLAG